MALSDLQIRNLKATDKPYKKYDEKGLYVQVHPNGSKYFRFKYRFNGKEKVLALGVYPEVSLMEAREDTIDARRLIKREGKDPSEVKKSKKTIQTAGSGSTFRQIAQEWLDTQDLWTAKHRKRVLQQFDRDIYPGLGDRPIGEITTPEIHAMVKAVEARGAYDVASRVLQKCTCVLRYANQIGLIQGNPASELSGVVKKRKTKHQPSVSPKELPQLLDDIASYSGYPVSRDALMLLMLTFVRPGELRFARWEEIEHKDRIWRIPGERMKMNEEHLVPLSSQSLTLLERLQPLTGKSEFIFQSERSRKKPISENTMSKALHILGYKGRATPHGFRATASSMLNEAQFNADAIEKQLSHSDRDQIRSSYTHHASFLDQRIPMMQWWADKLDEQSMSWSKSFTNLQKKGH